MVLQCKFDDDQSTIVLIFHPATKPFNKKHITLSLKRLKFVCQCFVLEYLIFEVPYPDRINTI